jgi:hypothetical protein
MDERQNIQYPAANIQHPNESHGITPNERGVTVFRCRRPASCYFARRRLSAAVFMKKLPLCLLFVITFAACNKPEAQEETPAPSSTPPAAKRTPPKPISPTPPKGNWMWKDEKGKERGSDPLGLKDNGLDRTKKK